MTKKVYRTAQGKTVDLGALILQNENVRAVGNMNVNARGDLLDSTNQTIDKKNLQVQRQYKQAAGAGAPRPTPVHQSTRSQPMPESAKATTGTEVPAQGLAAAMARSQAKKK